MSAKTVRDLSAGDRVGAYVVEAPIGEGGMACVFRAVEPGGERVALKFVRPEDAADLTFRRRFEREVEIAGRIEGSHVVSLLDSGEHTGVPYMVQPLMEGGSLQARLHREGRLGLEAAVMTCLQVAKGLAGLHRHGLIHRDLKPANILFDGAGVAHVADFGVAKDPERSLLTAPGQAVGSFHYMAPEQIRGEEITPAADVYALGCVTYQCLAGAPPFGNRRGMAVLIAHVSEEAPNLVDSSPGVPPEVGWAVARALEKQAELRPTSATAHARMVQLAAAASPLHPLEED